MVYEGVISSCFSKEFYSKTKINFFQAEQTLLTAKIIFVFSCLLFLHDKTTRSGEQNPSQWAENQNTKKKALAGHSDIFEKKGKVKKTRLFQREETLKRNVSI